MSQTITMSEISNEEFMKYPIQMRTQAINEVMNELYKPCNICIPVSHNNLSLNGNCDTTTEEYQTLKSKLMWTEMMRLQRINIVRMASVPLNFSS